MEVPLSECVVVNQEDSCESQQVRTGLVCQEGTWRSH